MSGRVAAIAGVPKKPLALYVGTAGGGVWKSTDGGVTFKPVFDEHTQSIGAIAVDPSHPETVWVGTGESWVRNSVSVGTGVYRSTDGGATWTHLGLRDSERIARIVVPPRGGDTAFVCATGHLWDGNDERGVYRTADGGRTWNRLLFVNRDTGCSDLALDPQDPRILYAGMWQFRRRADFFTSGGPGSGLYKSTDGGETWRKIENGLPAGEKGRIAVAVAPSRPSVVYAVVEARRTALYRSDDLGESWTEMNASASVQARPFYFAQVVVDPADFHRVYKPGFSLAISTDGGRSFSPFFISGSRVHSDHHALWINPEDPHELVLGTDGGVYVSRDRGAHWRHVKALPISQFYEVAYDMEQPYNVYGGLQDNGSWMGPSRAVGGIQNRHWRNIGFGDGFHAYPDLADPDIAYVEFQGGNLLRVRKSTGETKDIKPYPRDGEPELRFNWNTPVHLSAGRPGTLYLGAQFLFRSRDRGESWERLSPDLTTNDPAKQRQKESGGLTIDNSTAENHTTIYTISEAPRNADVIWVGTDDGNLQVTRDGGGTWKNVVDNVPGLPPNLWVSHVEAGRLAEGIAYAAFDGHYAGDMRTYVYRTADFGERWEPLATAALEGYAHVIREDPVSPDLLFLGTELGLFISLDRGRSWARFEGKLPRVAVRDLQIHPREHDLAIATHGRGLYILDDITPLRHLTRETVEREVALLPSRPAVLTLPAAVQEFPGDEEFVGENPAEAASVVYHLKRRHLFGDLRIEVHDSGGNLVATHPGGTRRGLNRVEWPMRLRPPRVPPAASLVTQPFALLGPRVPEGTYTMRLVKGDTTLEATMTLVADPRTASTPEDRALQDRTALTLYAMVERLAYMVDAIIELRDRARARAAEPGTQGAPSRALVAYAERLDAFRAGLVATSEAGFLAGEERLREKLVALYGAVNGYEGRPTDSQLRRMELLARELEAAEARFGVLTGAGLRALSEQLARRRQQPLELLSRQKWERR
ncbi:MAG: exo-alpha-sialidase [Gemmatimonadetes bacterium]|nr:exo-alpha-sialidase [Gemmatimonadota bacterium]